MSCRCHPLIQAMLLYQAQSITQLLHILKKKYSQYKFEIMTYIYTRFSPLCTYHLLQSLYFISQHSLANSQWLTELTKLWCAVNLCLLDMIQVCAPKENNANTRYKPNVNYNVYEWPPTDGKLEKRRTLYCVSSRETFQVKQRCESSDKTMSLCITFS